MRTQRPEPYNVSVRKLANTSVRDNCRYCSRLDTTQVHKQGEHTSYSQVVVKVLTSFVSARMISAM